MQPADLPLRDIHVPPAPPWWPPAPGWWLVALAVALVLLAIGWWWRRRNRRRARVALLFDQALEAADTPAGQLAAMSSLLRRAARRIDPDADRLHGAQWLAFLDAHGPPRKDADGSAFADGPGRVLADGAWRPDVDTGAVEAVRPLARQRFLYWMNR